ncbi:ubiquinol-cytochrome-c reductase complex assembly factor 2-like [Actinia tenebrosa]|uniref:Mitochondrial nucleoid factor 1 n=1 Tax=Actinia tenebrosa TaxID=6105 RepID=A0A6P8J4S4_ACTTE|nr:ubiquinol-cytochrome-c reductase complex assembly factor 2-like [Actinia tenebrosa]
MASRSRSLTPQLYQRFRQVCEQWPVDKTRCGRDLGAHIKENFGANMKNSKIDTNEAEKMLDSLVKISSNYYKEKYPRKRDTAFSTDVAKEAGAVLSTQYQNQVREKASIWHKLVGKK